MLICSNRVKTILTSIYLQHGVLQGWQHMMMGGGWGEGANFPYSLQIFMNAHKAGC